MSMTEDNFKSYKSGDKVYISVNGTKIQGYFKSVADGKINIEDMNFRPQSYDLSELTPPHKQP